MTREWHIIPRFVFQRTLEGFSRVLSEKRPIVVKIAKKRKQFVFYKGLTGLQNAKKEILKKAKEQGK